MIESLLNILSPDYYEKGCRDKWIRVGFVLKYELPDNNGCDLFHKFSKIDLTSYNPQKVQDEWNNIRTHPRDKQLTIASLFSWAKTSNPQKYAKIRKINTDEIKKTYGFRDAQLADELISITKGQFLVRVYTAQKKKNYQVFSFKDNKWNEGENALHKFIHTEFRDYLRAKFNGFLGFDEICGLIDDKLMNDQTKNKIINQFKALSATSDVEFDVNPYLMGFQNGVLDLKTKEFRNMKYDDYILRSTGYNWIPPTDEQIAIVKKCIKEIMPIKNERKIYLIVLATCLIGKYVQHFFIFVGEGGNGKSFMNNLLMKALGSIDEDRGLNGYSITITSNILCSPLTGGNNQELANCNKMRMVVSQESSRDEKGKIKRLDNETVKSITGANVINATGKFSTESQAKNHSTVILECNKRPIFKGPIEDGEKRRLVTLIFRSTFTSNPDNIDNNLYHFPINRIFETETWMNEHRCALIWILLDYINGYDNGLLQFEKLPDTIKQETIQYIQSNNISYDTFMTDNFKITDNPDDIISIKDIRKIFWQVKEITKKSQKNNYPRNKFMKWIDSSIYKQYLKGTDRSTHLTNIVRRCHI
jgi:hypothetical protein